MATRTITHDRNHTEMSETIEKRVQRAGDRIKRRRPLILALILVIFMMMLVTTLAYEVAKSIRYAIPITDNYIIDITEN